MIKDFEHDQDKVCSRVINLPAGACWNQDWNICTPIQSDVFSALIPLACYLISSPSEVGLYPIDLLNIISRNSWELGIQQRLRDHTPSWQWYRWLVIYHQSGLYPSCSSTVTILTFTQLYWKLPVHYKSNPAHYHPVTVKIKEDIFIVPSTGTISPITYQ